MIRFTALILFLSLCLKSGWQDSVAAEVFTNSEVEGLTTRDDFVGSCKVLPGVNVSVSMVIGKWYVMSYQPPIPELIVDKCDEMEITDDRTNIFMKYSFEWTIPFLSVLYPYQPPYTAVIELGPTPGTFTYQIISFGFTLNAYATVLAFDEKGIIIHICLSNVPFYPTIVGFGSREPNDAGFSEQKSKATYWDDNWKLEPIDQNNCSYAF
ncbi:hypothetical protein CHUAL_010703 [Chamberlinius hualienensis]